MKNRFLYFAFAVSIAVHAIAFFADPQASDSQMSQILLAQGSTSVTINILPSIESRASKSPTEPQEQEREQEQVTETVERTFPPIPAVEKKNVRKKNNRPSLEPIMPDISSESDDTLDNAISANSHQPSSEDISMPKKKAQPVKSPKPKTPEIPEKTEISQNTIDSKAVDGDIGDQGVQSEAKAVGSVQASYPFYCVRKKQEGTVEVSVEIFPDGSAGKIYVVSSSGYSRLDDAAMKALKEATFIPAQKNGKSVKSVMIFPFEFKLKE